MHGRKSIKKFVVKCYGLNCFAPASRSVQTLWVHTYDVVRCRFICYLDVFVLRVVANRNRK